MAGERRRAGRGRPNPAAPRPPNPATPRPPHPAAHAVAETRRSQPHTRSVRLVERVYGHL